MDSFLASQVRYTATTGDGLVMSPLKVVNTD